MTEIFNQKTKTKLRQVLRNQPTKSETVLWKYLSNSQLGYKFRRQCGVGSVVVDFYCPKLMLALEIDGVASHDSKTDYDRQRQTFLENKNIKFLRFTETNVRKNIEAVLYTIENYLTNQR